MGTKNTIQFGNVMMKRSYDFLKSAKAMAPFFSFLNIYPWILISQSIYYKRLIDFPLLLQLATEQDIESKGRRKQEQGKGEPF